MILLSEQFGAELGGAVHVLGPLWGVIGDMPRDVGQAVRRPRADEQDIRHTEEAGGLQDVQRATHVRAEPTGGACLAGRAEDRRSVVDAVRPMSSHRVEDMHPLADVAAGDLDPPGKIRRAARQARLALEEHDLLAVSHESASQMDPDKSRAAGNQIPAHGATPASFTRATARTHAPPA